MNNLKKNMVLLCVAIMTISLVMVPFTPITQVTPQVATPQVSTPEQVMMDLQKYMIDRSKTGPLDSILSAYVETGTFPSRVARNDAGAMGIIITAESDADIASLEKIVDVNWKVDLGVMKLISAFVGGTDKVKALVDVDGVVAAYADSLKTDVTTGVEAKPVITADASAVAEPDAFKVNEWIGATSVNTLGYEGEGIRLGVIDTGTDFTLPDLVDAVDFGADGLPTSYDPTGYGFGCLLYRVNASVVDPATWLGLSGWNLLSYMEDGKYYVDWSSMNAAANYVNGNGPRVNNQGGLVNLDWWFDGYMAAWYPPSYPYWGNATAMREFYYSVMRQDLELPHPNATMSSPLSGGIHHYTIGYIMQQRSNPYMKIFAPAIVLNGTTIVIDWNTARAHTDFWNLNVYWEAYDFNDPDTWAYYEAMGDWSFVDDLEDGYYYEKDGTTEHTVMYKDWPDGRFGLGVLAHCWENNIFGLGMINGIGLSGRAIGIMYDGNAHGTFVAGQIASRGLTPYPIGLNGSLEYIKGVAPKATLMGVMTVGVSNEFNSMFYAAGFDYSAGYFRWNNESTHQMQITSNSWGWSGGQYAELWAIYSLIYAAIATPGYFDEDYPGMVQCFSAGNSGPGYGTAGAPSAAQIIHVGATTSLHTFQNSYGPDQGFDQLASFSSRGPLLLGYPKPDVVAPGNNVYGLYIQYSNIFLYWAPHAPTVVYGGTSMACPLTAGSAALMIEAYNATKAAMPRPDYIKTVLQSTAVDLGMDPLAQGHGRIDVAAAVDYIEGNSGIMWHTLDSNINWGIEYGAAWAAQMNPFDGEGYSDGPPPAIYADASLYFGSVAPGGTASITFHGTWFDGAPVELMGFDWIPTYYTFDQVFAFNYETSIYNETTSTGSNRTTGGYFKFSDYLTGDQLDDFYAAKYVTIHISGDEALFGDDEMWAFVFDWSDTSPTNAVPDYYNPVTGLGDELTRWQYGGGTAQNIKMDLSHPDGVGELFPNTGIVMVHDDNIWGWPYTGGNTLDVKIVLWKEVIDTQIAIDANGGIIADLTVAATTDYGIHQGFIAVWDGADLIHKIPYTYNVVADLATHDGSGVVLANGPGDEWTPYDPALVNAGWDTYYESCDYGVYVVDVTDAGVTNVVVRIEWTLAGTDMDLSVYGLNGQSFGTTAGATKSTDTSAVAIMSITEPVTLIIHTSVNWLQGPLPEPYTVTVYGYDDSLPTPELQLTYYSRDNPTKTPISGGGSAVGDHVTFNATWTYPEVGGIPEFVVTSTEIKVLYGNLFDSGWQPLVNNLGSNPFSGVINPAAFAWESVPVSAGDVARVVADFTNGDCDILAWYSTVDMGSRTYANNLLGAQMATGAHPEVGSFAVTTTGTVEFGIFNYDNAAGNYRLTVDTRLGLEPARVYTDTIEIDTYYLLANATYSVLIDSDTGTNVHYMLEIPDIFIGNFFAPVVTVDVPEEISTNLFNITWSVTDLNEDDTHYYALFLSNDGGQTYQLLQQNGTQPFYLWNAAGWLDTTYRVKVRAYSLDFTIPGLCDVDNPPTSYWPGDFADGYSAPFDAGDVIITPPPTTTTTPPPTTTTTTTPIVGIDPLLIGLVGGIGVGVVIILILFLIKKK